MKFHMLIYVLHYFKSVFPDLELSIYHSGDINAHYSSRDIKDLIRNTCEEKEEKAKSCVGGLPRMRYILEQHREAARSGHAKPMLYFDCGALVEGTVWHHIHNWKIAAEFMKLLKPDAMSFGYHEFKLGNSGLKAYLDAISGDIAVIGTNLNTTFEPALKKMVKRKVMELNGTKIGVVSYIHKAVEDILNIGNFKISDYIYVLKDETERLASEGVHFIIAVSNVNLGSDIMVAREVSEIDLVIGGGSGILFYNGVPPVSYYKHENEYPKYVQQLNGKKVPILHSAPSGLFLGCLNVTLDGDGNIIRANGNPIFLSRNVPEDKEALDLLKKFKVDVDRESNIVIGNSTVALEGSYSNCRNKECNFGNLVNDALVNYVAENCKENTMPFWTNAAISYTFSALFLTDIYPVKNSGKITRRDIYNSVPYDDIIFQFSIPGSALHKVLETSVYGSSSFLQYSGVKVAYDMSQPKSDRVVSAKVRCAHCLVPHYKEIDQGATYNIVTTEHGFGGHPSFNFLLPHRKDNVVATNTTLVRMIFWYFEKFSPVFPEEENRIHIVKTQEISQAGRDFSTAFALPVTYLCFIL